MAATAHTHCCCGGPTPPQEFPCCRETAGPFGTCDMQTPSNCFNAGGYIVPECINGQCFESGQIGRCRCNPLDAAPLHVLWYLTQPIDLYLTCLTYAPQQNWPECNNVSTNNLKQALIQFANLAHLIPISVWRTGQPCDFNHLFPLSYPSGCTPGQTINTAVQASGRVSFDFGGQCFINGGMSSSLGVATASGVNDFGARPPTGCGCFVTKLQATIGANGLEAPIAQCPPAMGCVNSQVLTACSRGAIPVFAELVW